MHATKTLAATAATIALLTVPAWASGTGAAVKHTRVKVFVRTGESVRCPRGGAQCVVTVRGQATSGSRMVGIGRAIIKIAPGARTKLTFRVNRVGVKLLHAHRRLPVLLTVAVRRRPARHSIVLSHTVIVAGFKHG